MRISEHIRDVDPADLADDDDTVTLPTGHTVRVSWDADRWADPTDYMGEGTAYGSVEWSRVRYNGYGEYSQRPAGMDGAAEILDRDGMSVLWWQPPADIAGDQVARARVRVEIMDMLRDGLSTALLTLADADGHGMGYASLGGISGASDYDYRVEIARDLLYSLAHTVGTRETLSSWGTYAVPA